MSVPPSVGLISERSVELPDTLLDPFERAHPALGRGIVGDGGDDAAVGGGRDADTDARGRAAADRLVDQLADDRVQRDARRVADLAGAAGVDVEGDPM